MKKLIVIIFFIFGLPITRAEVSQVSALTLSAAMRQAEEQSPVMKGLRATIEKTSWEKNEAFAGYLPHLSIGYDHFFSSTYLREGILFGGAAVSFPAAFPQDNLTIDVSWTIFDGFNSYNKYRAADLRTEAMNYEFQHAQFLLDQSVRIAFYQSLAAQKLFEVAQQNIKTLEDHLSRAKLTARAGYGTQFDVLRIEATLEEARADREQAENNVQITRDSLFEMMGVAKDDGRRLEGELPVLTEDIVSRDLQYSISDRADIRSLVKKQEATSAQASASANFWYPSISLFAQEEFYQFGSFDPVVVPNTNYQNSSFLGVRLRWNLFDGGFSYAKRQQAAQMEIESQSQTEKARLSVAKEVDMWKRKFFYGVSLYRARLRALTEFQESVRLAEIGIKAGSRTHTEMLDAELDLFRARGGLVRAQTETIEALSRLELAIGRKLVYSF